MLSPILPLNVPPTNKANRNCFLSSPNIKHAFSWDSIAVIYFYFSYEKITNYLFFIEHAVKSQGIFQFKSASVSDTNVRETIYYQCPPFMGMYCRREVEFQRNAIMANLSSQLSTRLMHKIPM